MLVSSPSMLRWGCEVFNLQFHKHLLQVERDAQEMADREGVKVFQAEIIYHLFDRLVCEYS